MARSRSQYNTPENPPPFRKGDWVVPSKARTKYPGWHPAVPRQIAEVVWDGDERYGRWSYRIFNPQKNSQYMDGYSHYNPDNFELASNKLLGTTPMTQKAQFFAIRLQEEQTTGDGSLEITDVRNTDAGAIHTTPLYDTKQDVVELVRSRILHGERWMVLQTVCLLEGEEPRPPVRITEYR